MKFQADAFIAVGPNSVKHQWKQQRLALMGHDPALPVGGLILPLRFLKGALAAAQYVNRAEEGRLAKPQGRLQP
jgi:hypothetical protein